MKLARYRTLSSRAERGISPQRDGAPWAHMKRDSSADTWPRNDSARQTQRSGGRPSARWLVGSLNKLTHYPKAGSVPTRVEFRFGSGFVGGRSFSSDIKQRV